jgi:hypothetical protein
MATTSFRAVVRRDALNAFVRVPVRLSRAFAPFADRGRVRVAGTIEGHRDRAGFMVKVRFAGASPKRDHLELGFWFVERDDDEPRFSRIETITPNAHVHRTTIQQSRCADCHFSGPDAPRTEHLSAWEHSAHSRNNVGCERCHGDAVYQRPSARALETRCAQCHGPNRIAPRQERAEAARTLYNTLHESRDLMKTVRLLVNRVSDKPRRTQLDEAHQQAEVPLIQAVQAGHQFVSDDLKEHLSVARERIEALLGQLANPKP